MKNNPQISSSSSTTKKEKTIFLNNSKYLISISKLDYNESISIKLTEENSNKNIFYLYEASKEEIIKEIKALFLCENIDQMINALNEVLEKEKIKFLEKDEKYFLEFEFCGIGLNSKSEIQLLKYDLNEPNFGFNNEIKKIHNKFNELKKEIFEIKNNEKIFEEIEKKINEKIKEKEEKLFEKFEKKISEKFIKKEEINEFLNKENEKNNVENSIEKLIDEKLKNSNEKNLIEKLKTKIEEKIEEIKNIKSTIEKIENNNYLKEKINEFFIPTINNNIKENQIIKKLTEDVNLLKKTNENFIILKIKIDEKNLGKKINLLNQKKTYKYFNNFELDDIEIIIDNEKFAYKIYNENDFEFNKESENCKIAQKINYELNKKYDFNWIFSTTGIHIVKIIFRKKLSTCEGLFSGCMNLIEIDCSHFDCSKVSSCCNMFSLCEKLEKINFGNLNFSLSESFEKMFLQCKNLIELNVSNFNTKNGIYFNSMFEGCEKLKKINVEHFKTSNCVDINCIFKDCKNVTEIDILNWDMSKIERKEFGNPIKKIFYGCEKLKLIKMNVNFIKKEDLKLEKNLYFDSIIKIKLKLFKGIADNGLFMWKKGLNCDFILEELPFNWNRKEVE